MLNPCPAPAKLTRLLEDLGPKDGGLLDTECLPSHGDHCLSSTSKVDLVGLTLVWLGIWVLSTSEVASPKVQFPERLLLLHHHPHHPAPAFANFRIHPPFFGQTGSFCLKYRFFNMFLSGQSNTSFLLNHEGPGFLGGASNHHLFDGLCLAIVAALMAVHLGFPRDPLPDFRSSMNYGLW